MPIGFELAPDRSRSLSWASGDAGFRTVTVDDVLYLPNALEWGQSLCLIQEKIVPVEAVLDPTAVGFLAFARNRQPAEARPYAGEFDVVSFDRTACVLGNLFSRNFGHWTEELLKVVVLEQARVDCVFVMPRLPPFARQFLELLGVHASRVVELTAPTCLTRGVFSTAVSHQNLSAHPGALELLRHRIAERLGPAPAVSVPRRVWLERGVTVNGGVVVNRDEVEGCLARYRLRSD